MSLDGGPSTCWNLLYAVELACIYNEVRICTRLLWVVPSGRPLVKPRGIETRDQGPEVLLPLAAVDRVTIKAFMNTWRYVRV